MAGIDLGGTKTAGGLVDRAGARGPVLTRPTPAMDGPERVLDQVAHLVNALAWQCDGHLVGVGVGAAGVIDENIGTVVSATDAIRDWPGTNVAEGLHQRLGLPVLVDNDVNAHAAGEAWLGAGVGHRRVLMVAVGTGVGGALVVDGHPVRGAHHVGGEIGHIPARGADHLRCACGRPGHIEAISAGPGLLRHFHSLGGDSTIGDARQVVQAASADAIAAQAVDDAAQALGRCLAGVITTVDPDLVVIGGGMADAGPRWWQGVEQTARSELTDALDGIPIVRAKLGAVAAVVGAARLVWTEADMSCSPREERHG